MALVARPRGTLTPGAGMDQEFNPYQPPSSASSHDIRLDPLPIILVGPGTRFINFIIDYVVCFFLQMGFGIIVVLLFKDAGINHLQAGCVGNIYGILITLVYYTILEYKFGWTLGKLATRTRVVNETGHPITLLQAVWRSFSRFVPFEPFSLLGKESRGWHDTWPKTFVTRPKPALAVALAEPSPALNAGIQPEEEDP
jgi:uncharacterized RDD family membrane protein YckC